MYCRLWFLGWFSNSIETVDISVPYSEKVQIQFKWRIETQSYFRTDMRLASIPGPVWVHARIQVRNRFMIGSKSGMEFIDLNPRSVNVWRPTTAASLAPSAPINRESDHPSSPPSINHTTQLRNAYFTISPDHGPMSLPYTQYFQQA